MFKVRWKGNWPPDQNPTWEPEENIDKPLVRKYLAKRASAGETDIPVLPVVPQLKRKFSSVAEAVMGDVEDEHAHRSLAPPGASMWDSVPAGINVDHDMGHRATIHGDNRAGTEDDDDILQVTEVKSRYTETPYRSKEFNDALMRELETSFRRQDVRRSSEGSNASISEVA
ncbi:hypothetical protein Micbo1qcDRAFT_163362 [Microdochium bolleyi]|uniref:Chromo domain-containing protein n=1 Tax=Microdochium bolleyi TaxID=196109 RepID=A0A136J2W9_9PEZI|nr:hypothetical protein Micbo1qcDRAFT_163362 [Microdochium bolleyi]